jgi:hypothetical protein
VKAISDLAGLRRTAPGAFRVQTVPVPGDEFDVAMSAEPIGDARRRAIRKQIGDRAPLKVNKNGAETMTLPPGPVIDAHHAERLRGMTYPGRSFELT